MSNNNWDIREIDSLLADHLTAGSKILKYDIKSLTAPGENYGSVMQAVTVTIKEPSQTSKSWHLVAKRIPANKMLCDMFNIQETFKKELAMYLKAIPTLSQFEKDYGVNEKIDDLFAKCYGGRINLKPGSNVVDEDAVMLFENLKIMGFDVGDRLIGFDEDHVLRILEDLANFHAVPIALRIKRQEDFENTILPIVKGVKIADGFEDSAKQMAINEIIEVIKDIKKCQPYIDTISSAISANLDGRSRINQSFSQFSTISHTDYWVNNTMILKNDKGTPIKNKIVDLQMPSYCSATRDVLFFLYSSVQPTVLYKNIDRFLKFYYNCFVACLQKFDIDMTSFSWENFNSELSNSAFIELGHILIMYKPILTKRGAIDDMSNLNMDNMLKTEVSSDYESRVTDCILSFIDRNWI